MGRNQVVGAEAAESPAAAGQERRIHPRRRAAWRVVPDAADNGRSKIHSIDIRYGDQWIPLRRPTSTPKGFNGMVLFSAGVGDIIAGRYWGPEMAIAAILPSRSAMWSSSMSASTWWGPRWAMVM
ncbi:MAG: hypothetical protein U5J62_04785 [Desulfurivibrio sp.]|nr:hypothetical protein [Desulfurivibrio sp.]